MTRCKPDSRAGHVLRYLRAMGNWVPAGDLAQHADIPRNQLCQFLAGALQRKEVQRQHKRGRAVFWRIAPPKPSRTFSIPNWPPGFVPHFSETGKAPK